MVVIIECIALHVSRFGHRVENERSCQLDGWSLQTGDEEGYGGGGIGEEGR